MTNNRMGLEQTLSDEQVKELGDAMRRFQGYYDPIDDKEKYQLFANIMTALKELVAYRKASKEPVGYIGVNMLADMRGENRQSGRVWINDIGAGECIPLYAVPPPQPVTVPDEKLFSDQFWRMIDDNNKDIDIGQLGHDNCNALCKAAYQAACNSISKSVTNEP